MRDLAEGSFLAQQCNAVFDELGYLHFAQSGGQLLFQFTSRLYEQTSIVATPNLAVGEWTPCSETPKRPRRCMID